jgi:hypothetical protein
MLLLLRPRGPCQVNPYIFAVWVRIMRRVRLKPTAALSFEYPAGARRFVLRTRPCLPRRGGARAMRIQCSPSRTARLDARRCRPPSFGCWRCPGRPSSTAHARAIAHPATPPPSRPIRAAARVSRRLPLDVGTCTPNGPKPGWLVAASFSRRRCVLCVPRFPRAHVHMQSRLAAPSRGRFATARMSGRVE